MGKIRIILENEICVRERCEFYDDATLCKDCDSLDKLEEKIKKLLPSEEEMLDIITKNVDVLPGVGMNQVSKVFRAIAKSITAELKNRLF